MTIIENITHRPVVSSHPGPQCDRRDCLYTAHTPWSWHRAESRPARLMAEALRTMVTRVGPPGSYPSTGEAGFS